MADIFTLIQNAPDHVVRTIFAGLCSDHAIEYEAYKLFAKIARASRAGMKRKLPPAVLFICLNCKEAYSEAENASDACYYHDGNTRSPCLLPLTNPTPRPFDDDAKNSPSLSRHCRQP